MVLRYTVVFMPREKKYWAMFQDAKAFDSETNLRRYRCIYYVNQLLDFYLARYPNPPSVSCLFLILLFFYLPEQILHTFVISPISVQRFETTTLI